MQKPLAIIVDWFGPYSLQTAKKIARESFGTGVYLAIGRQKFQKAPSLIQYIGLGNLLQRLKEDHHKLRLITRDRKIWLGEVGSEGIPGPKRKRTNVQLDLVEWAHAYFLALPLNDKKRQTPPDRSVTVVNRWWKADFVTLRRRRPHPDWPILIDYLGEDSPVRVSWRWDRAFG